MADLLYMADKLDEAIHSMAVTDGPLRQRVRDAYVNAVRVALDTSGSPDAQPSPALVGRLHALRESATQEGTIDESFAAMSDADIAETAEEIYEISLQVRSELSELEDYRRARLGK